MQDILCINTIIYFLKECISLNKSFVKFLKFSTSEGAEKQLWLYEWHFQRILLISSFHKIFIKIGAYSFSTKLLRYQYSILSHYDTNSFISKSFPPLSNLYSQIIWFFYIRTHNVLNCTLFHTEVHTLFYIIVILQKILINL